MRSMNIYIYICRIYEDNLLPSTIAVPFMPGDEVWAPMSNDHEY